MRLPRCWCSLCRLCRLRLLNAAAFISLCWKESKQQPLQAAHVPFFFARLSVCASASPRRIPPLALALTVCDAVAACFSLVFPLAKRNVGCFVVFLAARHLAVAASGSRAPVFYTVSPIKNNTNNDNAEASSSRSVREAFLILKKHICVNVQILTQQKTNVNRRNRVQKNFFFIKC